MAKYRKKPVVVEAVQWNGSNVKEILMFAGSDAKFSDSTGNQLSDKLYQTLSIETLEGTMKADIGDFIIKGVANEFYPCKESVFLVTYEKVE